MTKNTEKGKSNLKVHENQLKSSQITSCYYMTCYTRSIVATISVPMNNTKFYKWFNAI